MKRISIIAALVLAFGFAIGQSAWAFSLPALTLSPNGNSVQLIVSNADSNATVSLYYPSGTSNASVNIGTTNTSGYYSTNIPAGSYGIQSTNPVFVSVDGIHSASIAWPSVSASSGGSLYLSQTAVTLSIGQNTTVAASNANSDLSIPGNTNPSIVSATLNGSTITLNALAAGSASITVCASTNGCGTISVTVQPSYLTTPGINLTPNNTSINIGQAISVIINGYASGPYYISSNTGQSSVSASVNGSNLMLTGLAAGPSNITVCASGGQCATTFVNVVTSGAPNTSSTAVVNSNGPLALASLTFSSNATNGSFLGSGNALSINFSANQSIVNPQVTINGQTASVTGSGNGPYMVNYAMTGGEVQPIPVVISFSNSNGASTQTAFWVANTAGAAPSTSNTNTTSISSITTSNTTAVNCPAGYTCTSSPSSTNSGTTATTPASTNSSYVFSKYLYMGINNIGDSDPDVVALQQRLKKDGFFTGAATGYFGSQTRGAVMAYQKAHSLNQLGVVGPSTRDLLNKGI